MALNLNDLRKLGFTRRQSDALAPALQEGGGPKDILRYSRLWPEGAPQGFQWDNGSVADTNPNNSRWRCLNNTWLEWNLDRNDGTAFELDGNGDIVYGLGGIYLNSLQFNFISDPRLPGSADKGEIAIRIEDWNVTLNLDLTDYFVPGWRQFTWMAYNQAGDQNTTPYISLAVGPQPIAIAYAEYTSVRLLA